LISRKRVLHADFFACYFYDRLKQIGLYFMLEKLLNEGAEKSRASARIEGARAQIAPTGAVDSEHDALNKLQADLRSGEITPEQAESEVDALLAGRDDYH